MMSRVMWGHKEPSLEQGDGQRRLWVGISQAEFRMNILRCLERTENKNFLLRSILELAGGQWWRTRLWCAWEPGRGDPPGWEAGPALRALHDLCDESFTREFIARVCCLAHLLLILLREEQVSWWLL